MLSTSKYVLLTVFLAATAFAQDVGTNLAVDVATGAVDAGVSDASVAADAEPVDAEETVDADLPARIADARPDPGEFMAKGGDPTPAQRLHKSIKGAHPKLDKIRDLIEQRKIGSAH